MDHQSHTPSEIPKSAPSNIDNYHLKRSISSDNGSRLDVDTPLSSNTRTGSSTPIGDHAYSSSNNTSYNNNNELNETKRRKIQDLGDDDHDHLLTTSTATNIISKTSKSSQNSDIDNTTSTNFGANIDNALDSTNTSTTSSSIISASTTTTTTTSIAITSKLQSTDMEGSSRLGSSRRSVKRVNYADPDDFDIDDEEREQSPSQRRGSSRSRTKTPAQHKHKQQQSSSSKKKQQQHRRQEHTEEEDDEYEGEEDGHLDDEGEDIAEEENDSDISRDVKIEPESSTFGKRTLRDRSAIAAPKPFHIIHPTPPPVARTSRNASSRQDSRSHYGESENSRYRSSNSRSALSAKRSHPIVPSQPPRPITENMRITRGMSGSLAPDSSNSRDVTPDQSAHRSLRSNSRFHRALSTDEDHELETGGGTGGDAGTEGREDNDEEMDDAAEDSQQSPFVDHQDPNSSLIRMTRLRARAQSQSTRNSRHTPEPSASSRSKSAHSQSRQDSDRKYDLRERPKNRPTYIADRPVPSPTRPRTSRINFGGGGRDSFMRPRQNRSSFLEALSRAVDSSEDERDISNSFSKRRSGPSDPRSSTSRILPMNMHELAESRRDVIMARAGGQLADTDPLAIGKSVDFSKVGGLDHHIKSLKEMVILPLLYPEVYSRFQIMPPRGVLFHGPPGTGKTLLARALASSCSTETQKVAFFMRKGADCLSKWVGEAERQLRLLFEEAKAWQPSIIFFDEIDGLCPVRSSKQEQIHSSIVSTMLALMDGLDGRGQVIVIGATNRIDAIDPALRRPGRFDREFYFPLPNEAARRAIIEINTCGWEPALDEGFKNELARITTRYCGADIKALCTEAALKAIRRRYPQIYDSNEKLLIDTSSIVVEEVDMLKSAKALVPASYRVTGATASPLPANIKPLLQDQFEKICGAIDRLFPTKTKSNNDKNDDEDADDAAFQAMGYRSLEKLKTFRPRVIIAGHQGMGQRYIGPALLHYLEGCTVQQFDLAALMSESSRTPEAACVQFFIEVKRHAPSVIYIPHLDVWWTVMSDTVKATFSNLLEDLNPDDRILFLATSEIPLQDLPIAVRRWFVSSVKGRIELSKPDQASRKAFFETLIVDLGRPPTDFQLKSTMNTKAHETLKKAPPPQPRVPTAEEKKLLKEHDQYVLRELRISLRSIVEELFKERRFKPFFRPVEPEDFPDYYQIVKKPMDLTTINDKVDDRMYLDVKEFLADIDQIVENTSLYNDIHDPSRIIYKARAFQDVVHGMISRLDPELIIESEKTAARVRQEVKAQQRPQGERSSRRQLGLEAPAVPDDPEMFLRHRSHHNHSHHFDHSHNHNNDGANTGVNKREDTETGVEDEDEDEEKIRPSGNGSRELIDPLRILKQEDLDLDLDDDMSGTSLSMSSSTTSLIALTSEPIETSVNNAETGTATTTDESEHQQSSIMDGINSRNQQRNSMDIDTPTMVLNDDHSEDCPATQSNLSSVQINTLVTATAPPGSRILDSNMEMANKSDSKASFSESISASVTSPTAASAFARSTSNHDTILAVSDQNLSPNEGQCISIKEPSPPPLPSSPPVLHLDVSKVSHLQQALVDKTEYCTVEELDQLRAALYDDLWEHRLEWNKEPLLQDMNETLESITLLHKETKEDIKNYNTILREIS
ncbi:hypothetical protein FBU30_006305 [Linnemannia zychae]|nr:hypothetical protein FBU30_006305 [Linnemannia zychae]